MKMNKTGFMNKFLVGLVVLFLLCVTFVMAAVPEGPSTLTSVNNSRRTAASAPTLQAFAGNISHLVVVGTTVTQSWQGYVGNITGTISLDDATGYTLYDWSLGDPEGEIYATYLPTVSWVTGEVMCWNWSKGGNDEDYLTLQELEGTDQVYAGGVNLTYNGVNAYLGVAADDVDGVDETFSPLTGGHTHSSFYVGGQVITGTGNAINGACPLAKLYNGSTPTGSSIASADAPFEEVLLYQDTTGNTNDGVIYTSILQSDVVGYDNNTWDFEMIVGENGHNGDTQTTTYYFYVELE